MLAISKTAVLHRDTAAPTPPNQAPELVLVTEGQVMFATAAAVGAAPRPWLIPLWQRLVRSVSVERQLRRRYPPRRLSYFEQAATAREMDRL